MPLLRGNKPHFTFYCDSLFVVLSGILSMRQQPPPILNYREAEAKIGRDVPDMGKRTALNDCFIRNMYRYEFIAIIDLDEIIIPVRDLDYTGLLRHVQPCKNCKGEKLSQMYRSHMFCHYENDATKALTNSSDAIMMSLTNGFNASKTLEISYENNKNNIFSASTTLDRHIADNSKLPFNASASFESINTSITNKNIGTSKTLENHLTNTTNTTFNVSTTPTTSKNDTTSTKQASSLMIETRTSFNVMKGWDMRKTLINPRLCVFTWAHGCILSTRSKIPLQVKDDKSAHVHHYRTSCSLKRYAHHSEDTNTYVEDKHMKRYIVEVRKRVENVRAQLGLD